MIKRQSGTQEREGAGHLRDQVKLSNQRYRGGVTSYLEVLDTERQALNAEVQYSDAFRAELDSVVRLYKSLGGGWQ